MSHQSKPTHSPPKKRLVTVDGLRYSLETGDPVGRAATRPTPVRKAPPGSQGGHVILGERPLPKAVEFNAHHRTVMHPNHDKVVAELMHPSVVEQPPHTERRQRRSFFRNVVAQSLKRPHDKRATNAVLLATIIAPGFWVLVAAPWVMSSWVYFTTQPTTRWYTHLYSFVQGLSFARLVTSSLLVIVGMLFFWLLRHALLLMNYTLNLRHIDHRQVQSTQIWRQSLSRLGRFASIAAIDFLAVAAMTAGATLLILRLSSGGSAGGIDWQNLGVNLVIIITFALFVLMSIHRPLGRVMLAATNQPLSFIVLRSYGLIQRSRGLAVIAGLVWLLISSLTAVSLGGTVLATVGYGFYGIAQTWLARVALAAAAAVLLYIIIAVYTIWSQHYWALTYHYLAHRYYKARVSELFVADPYTKSVKTLALQGVLALLVVVGLLLGGFFIAKNPIESGIRQLQAKLPVNLQDILPKR